MEKRVDLYVKWNKAFLDYFFTDSSKAEVFLYVNQQVLDEVGTEYGLGNHIDFLNTVLLNREDRACFYGTMRKLYVGYGPYNKTNPSLFKFGTYLIDDSLGQYVPCAYLNFVILAVFIASEAQLNRQVNLGRYLSDYLQKNTNDNGLRDGLELLFEALHNEYPEFKNYRLNEQRYVGLLKYQLVLSKAEIDKLELALYRNGFLFSEDNSYQEIVYKIRDYVDLEIKERLDESLVSEPHRKRFEDVIMNFDMEEYAALHNIESTPRKSVGTFAHALYFGDGGNGKLILLTDVKDLSLSEKGFQIYEEPFDSLNGYNPKHVMVDGSDHVNLKDLLLDTDSCKIKTLSNNGVYFFKRCNDDYYIETHQLTNADTYIAVKDDRRTLRRWEQFCQSQNCILSLVEDNTIIEEIFGEGWVVYYAINGFNQQYYKDTIQVARKKISINETHIQMKSGIRQENKKNVYLPNALPYFEFPVKIDKSYLSVSINVDGYMLKENEDFALFTPGNNLIIDITNVDISLNESYDVDIFVGYKSPDFEESINKSFSVCGQEVNYENKDLFKYDNWGRNKSASENHNKYVSGNKVFGSEEHRVAGVSNNINKLHGITDEDYPDFYFINLLSAICFNKGNKPITNSVLKKCIRYSSTRRNINYLEDEKFVSTLRNLLVNSGYLCPDYEHGVSKYQAMPPTFLRIPPRVNLESGHNAHPSQYMYMLGGCYTRKFLVDLCEYCEDKGVLLFVKGMDENNVTSAYSLLPPILLLDDSFDVNDFIVVTGNNCEHTSNDFALALMDIQPRFEDFENSLVEIEDAMFNSSIQFVKDEEYPRIRTSIAGGYQTRRWIELSENHFASTDIQDFSWMDLYCRYKLQKPTLLYNGTGEICVTNNVHFPYLVQRAMFLMNVGQPQYRKVFISNNRLTSDALYSTLKIYNVGTGRERLDKILSLVTNKQDYTNHPMLCSSKSFLTMEMELWTCKEKLKRNPYFIALKRVGEDNYIAFATKEKIYVNNEGILYEVLGTPNVVMTILLENAQRNTTWEQMDIEFTTHIIKCPNSEFYKIEKLLIK